MTEFAILEDLGPSSPVWASVRRGSSRAFDIDDARWVEQPGGRAVLYSDAAAEEFLAWFRKGGWEAAAGPTREDLQTVL